ncbi:MAG TPA: thiamine ABC transporter substrate-binding protein [Ilumatobacteraceae bacterium]|nr:thiamine ABC transporter substrate-binding protein [Ilumatobacteraceae bacterium]
MTIQPMKTRRFLLPLLAGPALLLAACGTDTPRETKPASLTLVAYSSFPDDSPALNEAFADFTKDTGIKVQILNAGDTGTMVTKAVLTSGNPEGDVIFGVDNTFLSAANKGKVFHGQPRQIDSGDVCVNYDKQYFADKGVAPPQTFDDLIRPDYKDMLVVENPTSSSPGLAFLMGTIAAKGADGWVEYWKQLRANGVEVVDSWDVAYYERFSGSGNGDRPLVVSYGTSPPAEVIFADPPRDEAVTGVATETCFHQEEFAGVLRGTKTPLAAKQLVDFLVSERFQKELPLTLFVYPVLSSVTLPPEFVKFGVKPDKPFSLDPATIDANREKWQDKWTQTVLR